MVAGRCDEHGRRDRFMLRYATRTTADSAETVSGGSASPADALNSPHPRRRPAERPHARRVLRRCPALPLPVESGRSLVAGERTIPERGLSMERQPKQAAEIGDVARCRQESLVQ